jgi:PAS domain S-box-containing protein
MPGKLLIVEDEPIVALDLQQELEELGCEVTGLAESADAALMSVEENRPDLALMDIRIDGSLDGIQAARLLRHAYQVPVVFLTSYSDKETLVRAAQELPYGYLTKPFRSRELHAALSIALHRSAVDAAMRESNGLISETVHGMHEAVVFVSADGIIEFMNRSAEEMTGLSALRARGMLFSEVFDLTDIDRRLLPMPCRLGECVAIEEFGWFLHVPGKDQLIVDFAVRSLIGGDGAHSGHIISLRSSAQRMCQDVVDSSKREIECFDNASVSMVQLDGDGRVMRINQQLLNESGLPMECLIGRSLNDLLADPDPRVTRHFVSRLLRPFRPARKVHAH